MASAHAHHVRQTGGTVKRLVALSIGLALVALLGCASRAPNQSGARALGEATEDPAVREAMWDHVTQVWPTAAAALSNTTIGDDPVAPREAVRSTPGTPTVVWGYAPPSPSNADAWDGIARTLTRTSYVIPALVDGRPVASAWADDYSGSWRVWPVQNYALMAQDALAQITSHLGTSEYEWCYVHNGGMWVVAHTGDRTAGVYVAPFLDHREGDPPTGVLSGPELKRWMDSPMGR